MSEAETPRAILIGDDDARLLTLAGELEARGLEVALYRELARGLAECTAGRGQILVALGRTAAGAADAMPVPVPLLLIDVPEAAPLSLRPLGPRTVLGASSPPAVVAERVLSLLAPRDAAGMLSQGAVARGAGGEARLAAAPAAATRPPAAPSGPAAPPDRRRVTTVLRWVAIALVGLALGYLIGLAVLNLASSR